MVISETLSQNKKSHDMLSVFNQEGDELTDTVEIANAFNTYFANIGKNLSCKLIKMMLMPIKSLSDFTHKRKNAI